MWWRGKAKTFDDRWCGLQEELEHEINPLPVGEEKRRCEALLADPAKFGCDEAPPGVESWLEPLALLLREFFNRYAWVEDSKGGCRFVRAEIGESSDDSECYAIGRNAHQDDLWVRSGEEVVYELFPGEEEPIGRYTTIYHYLLYSDRENSLIGSPADVVQVERARDRWLRSILKGRKS